MKAIIKTSVAIAAIIYGVSAFAGGIKVEGVKVAGLKLGPIRINPTNPIKPIEIDVPKPFPPPTPPIPTPPLPDPNKVIHDVAHGVDHFFKELDHLAKKNADKLALVGRAKACTQSLCYSEIYRDQQLKKERKEAQAKKDELLRQSRANIEKNVRENNLQLLRENLKSLTNLIASLKELLANSEKETASIQALLQNLDAETQRRVALKAMGKPVTPAKSQVADLVQRMTQVTSPADPVAMAQLEVDIEARAKQLGVDVATINKEIAKTVSDSTLQLLVSQLNVGLQEHIQKQGPLRANLIESQAQFEVADAKIKSLEAKGK